MRFDTILFDLDGTLTDSAPGILASVRHALGRAGLADPGDAVLRRFVGPPLLDSFQRYCGLTEDGARRAIADYREYYTAGGLFENRVYDGVPAMLDRLAAGGMRLLVATAKPEPYAQRILEHFGLADRFEAVHGATLDGQRIHKHEVIAWALAHTQEPGCVVMAGDRANDVEGAHMNGMPCIGVRGYGDEMELAGAEYLARFPAEVADLML